ncbi:hypothetical protein [Pseudomonas frederiksbergensis]|uniref:hypothetical protein n=1 Tax=Pseudomonas frederiksbergensis TaxID=104087 RepID=UPI003D1E6A41
MVFNGCGSCLSHPVTPAEAEESKHPCDCSRCRLATTGYRKTTNLDTSQQEIASLYAAYAQDVRDGTHQGPTFADALCMHELIDAIEISNRDGVRLKLQA